MFYIIIFHLPYFIDYLSISHIYFLFCFPHYEVLKVFSNLYHIQTPVLNNSNNFLVLKNNLTIIFYFQDFKKLFGYSRINDKD